MKKSSLKKTMLASTMAFALAIGTAVPAFAAPGTALDNGDIGTIVGSDATAADVTAGNSDNVYTPATGSKEASGQTKVGVFSKAGQVRVSVPTKVALALNSGGGEFSAPALRESADTVDSSSFTDPDTNNVVGTLAHTGYGIENLCGLNLKVSKIKGSIITTNNFAFKSSSIAAGTAPTGSTKIADLYVQLQPNGSTTGAAVLSTSDVTPTAANWTISKATEEGANITPTVLPIGINGSSSTLKDQIAETAFEATDAFNIVYTIGIA